MTFNFLGPGLTVNVEAKVKEQIILDSSGLLTIFGLVVLQRKPRKSLLKPRRMVIC